MNQTTHVQGHKRDLRVLAHLDQLKCLSQEQIHLLEFWNVSTEMSHRCTQRLEKDKLIRRVKMSWSDIPDWFYLYDEKRPDQIQHRLGKAWIYTAWHMKSLDSQNNQELTYFKSEERKFFDQDKTLPIIDDYGVMKHKVYGEIFYFGEFQVLESGNKWNKNYRKLFQTFAEDQILNLMVVTTGSYETLKNQLVRELSGMKNVRLEFYQLDKLKKISWRIVLRKREERRQKELV
ncbi:MAG: hypothetical protein Q8911_00180 [Bacillota bacterium]|nr:hypothetical protein [Bacillota bacterium]